MNEDYVTLDQSRELKKLGFSWKVCQVYIEGKFFSGMFPGQNWNEEEGNKEICSAPSLWQAQKWLRKKELSC